LVETGSVGIYVAGFVVRCEAMRRGDQRHVEAPGVHGLLPSTDDPVARLLVTDASDASTRIYGRLGFATVTRTTRFCPARAPSGL
jgi:hypothetical protein